MVNTFIATEEEEDMQPGQCAGHGRAETMAKTLRRAKRHRRRVIDAWQKMGNPPAI
ncbi:hypothetical protein ACL2XP_23665 [Sodalis sp. RH21]|uniref:hypothetical protein n=1 Tax=unclassified Sodalis (in: enterobacteria) TaxID=2636512 RepID=UPI0039B40244